MISIVRLMLEIVQSIELNFVDVENRFPSNKNFGFFFEKIQMKEKEDLEDDDQRVKSSKYDSVETTSDLTNFFISLISSLHQ